MNNQEMKILITGANGLLGQKLVRQLTKKNISFIASSKGVNRNSNCPSYKYISLDICDPKQVEKIITTLQPTHIIHTAAITNVDSCELDPSLCRKVNVTGTQLLIEQAKKINAHFQLLSTDFVFDGTTGEYSEKDQVNPLSVYGRSKVEAENLLLLGNYENYSIVRTIIVYGIGENLSRSNLFLWAREELSHQRTIHVVDDQFRSPTWADDLAWGCIKICIDQQRGIFHLSGETKFSIYEIALKIANFYGYPTHCIIKTYSKQLQQAAQRPPNTGFNISKANKLLGYRPKSIEETLKLLN